MENRAINATQIAVGQRVVNSFWWAGEGIVFRVHGDARAFDIVYKNGVISKAVPACIVCGSYQFLSQNATADEINAALSHAEQEEARKETEAKTASERRDRERAEHLANYSHLTPLSKSGHSNGRTAAANIRIELKRAFPKFKFSVKSDHNSVDVRWVDGPSNEAVEKIVGKYKGGSFDGMQDMYEMDADATFAQVFGNVRYVFCHRDGTLAGYRKAYEMAGNNPAEVPDDYLTGARSRMDDFTCREVYEAFKKADLR